jgi:NADPH:quinone reductase-like Zn-dependent oxidoreductase
MREYQLVSLDGPSGLRFVEKHSPAVGPRQIKMRVHAASLNYRDLMVVSGAYNPKQKLPLVPLSDAAGEILEVGDDAAPWKVGQRVATCFFDNWVAGTMTPAAQKTARGGAIDGVLAEEIVVNTTGLVAVPDHLSWEEAACLPCAGLTAWHAVVEVGQTKPGDTVLLLGTGGVSLFALQFAKLAGARVIITSSSDEKLEHARRLGADETINYKSHPDWEKQVRKHTDDRGVDLVVEVGGPGTLAKSMQACRVNGTIALIGVLSDPQSAVNPIPVLMNAIRLQGIYVGNRMMFEDMNRAVAHAELQPVVDRVFGFEEVPEAMQYQASGSHFGKVAIAVWQS